MPDEKNSFTARLEYYSDANGVIISTGTPNGFKTWGYSVNYDHAISSQAVWRIEARGFSSKTGFLKRREIPAHNNFFVSTALAISF